MAKSAVIGQALPNILWADCPPQTDRIMWRSQRSPIIPHDLIPSSNSILTGEVVPYEEGLAGVFRCDGKSRRIVLHAGRSQDILRPSTLEQTRWRALPSPRWMS